MEQVVIRIPAAPAYLQVVRLVAAGLAARLRFTIEEIEDLKIAVDELSSYLTGSQGRNGTLEIRFEVHDDRIEITGTGSFLETYKIRTHLTELSRMILETVVDSASLQQADGIPTFHLVKATSA